jgi:hypothetical protein
MSKRAFSGLRWEGSCLARLLADCTIAYAGDVDGVRKTLHEAHMLRRT